MEVWEGHTHVLGGEIQGHLCGWKIVRSWNVPLMNSLHAVEIAAIIIAYFMCFEGFQQNESERRQGLGEGVWKGERK